MSSKPQASANTSPENYLGYLDKEMTIMGILSAFCTLTVGGVASAFKGVKADDCSIAAWVWKNASCYVVAGCLSAMVAALFFYRQRSHLAWCYGQICLAQTDEGEYGSVDSWLDTANGWSSWRDYKAAFAAIGTAFAEFVVVVAASGKLLSSRSYVALGMPMIAAAAYIALMFVVMEKYNNRDHPWVEFFARMRIRKRQGMATENHIKRGGRTKRKGIPRRSTRKSAK